MLQEKKERKLVEKNMNIEIDRENMRNDPYKIGTNVR